jgi:hypothetical protein
MSKVDDFGRFHGHPSIILAACYPLQLDRISAQNVRDWLAECAQAASKELGPLIRVYESNGKQFIEISNFGQRTRTDSKFPAPCPQNADIMSAECAQAARSCARDSESYSKTESETYSDGGSLFQASDKTHSVKKSKSDPIEEWFDEEFWKIWIRATNDSKQAALKAIKAKAKTGKLRSEIMSAAKAQAETRLTQDPDWRVHCSTWINQNRWRDEIRVIPHPAKNGTGRIEDQKSTYPPLPIYHPPED